MRETNPSSVIDLFEAQVAAIPDAVAAVESDDRLTYAELSRRVDRIASRLRHDGVPPGQTVGLMLPRSIDAVAAMLGILKAGAAYVPIDPKYPQARIDYMLEDSAVRLVLTTRDLREERVLPPGASFRYVDITDAEGFTEGAGARFAPPAPDSIAYVIYTSGSTGTPKGVPIPHRALLHYVLWAKNYYLDGEPVDMPLFSSLAFDLTVTSIYLPLASGGKIVIYREEGGPRDLSIYRVIKEDQVGMIKLTPSHLALVGRIDLSSSRVQKLIVGGEDLKASLARRIHRAFRGRVEIFNEYGPTEATVGCMEHRFDPETDVSGSVPIGQAIDGAEILVLDDEGKSVRSGEIGEIFIGGAGLATGYVNKPEATSKRFVAHPQLKDRTVYRTGDLARYREDGKLEFMGRADRQVKIGGVRIELDEVESVLQDHEGIRSAVVTVHAPRSSGEEIFHCIRCALPSNYPGVSYDASGLCSVCRDYDRYRDRAKSYFGTMEELRGIFEVAKASREGGYDCLLLLSGGKDSSYVLYQLLDMDLKVLAYTLDNGYLSESAKDNISRIAGALGVDHVFGSTAAMDSIFRDSLEQFSNVCNGCFKTLYTLSMRLAQEKRIRYIVTGLSRGQLFETRLDFLFRNQVFDVGEIERDVQRARRVYHAQNDFVRRSLELGSVRELRVLDEIQFIDFYRYSDASRKEILRFLEGCKNWIRPPDTGRSTNCRINDVGIFVHNRERGFHNYALPYCWDVRLGLLDREEALRELETAVNMENVEDILKRIDYSTQDFQGDEPRLTAYYVSDREDSSVELRRHASARLPASMVPASFVRLDEIPLTVNGKVDWQALPSPPVEKVSKADYVASRDTLERSIAGLWERLLGAGGFGVRDRFFDVGGTSVLAVLLYTQLEEMLDSELPDPMRDQGWTIAEQADLLRAHGYGTRKAERSG
jgi:amino acid adenylation domain-containing protein